MIVHKYLFWLAIDGSKIHFGPVFFWNKKYSNHFFCFRPTLWNQTKSTLKIKIGRQRPASWNWQPFSFCSALTRSIFFLWICFFLSFFLFFFFLFERTLFWSSNLTFAEVDVDYLVSKMKAVSESQNLRDFASQFRTNTIGRTPFWKASLKSKEAVTAFPIIAAESLKVALELIMNLHSNCPMVYSPAIICR